MSRAMGWFSSDRTIRQYASDIWNVPLNESQGGAYTDSASGDEGVALAHEEDPRGGSAEACRIEQAAASATSRRSSPACTAIPSPFSVFRRSARAASRAASSRMPNPSPPSRWPASRPANCPRRDDARFLRGQAVGPQAPAAALPRPQCRRRMVVTDPYSFGPVLGPHGRLLHRRRLASAAVRQARRASHRRTRAPMACISRYGRPMPRRVSVVGDFNDWDGRRHPMRAPLATPASGRCSFPISAPAALQIRDHRARWREAAAEGRSVRLPLGTAPGDRLGHRVPPVRHDWGDEAHRAYWPRPTIGARRCRSTRSMPAPGSCATTARFLSWDETRRPADPLCRRHWLHPYRIPADHRASL